MGRLDNECKQGMRRGTAKDTGEEVEGEVRVKAIGAIVSNGAFRRYHVLSFSCNGVAAGRSQP